MNKIYKLKYSRTRNQIVVCSELETNADHSVDKTSSGSALVGPATRVVGALMTAIGLLTASVLPAQASQLDQVSQLVKAATNQYRDGLEIQAGQLLKVETTSNQEHTKLTTKGNAVFNWQKFNVGRNEILEFVQDSKNSAVLNRVVGGKISQILGQLRSNGSIFVVNPSGITVGKTARIDAAQAVLSTLDLTNQDFANYKKGQVLRFNDLSDKAKAAASVLNQGLITARDGGLALIGGKVANKGVLEARNGTVYLLAGNSIELSDLNNPQVRYKVTAKNQAVNLGAIVAKKATIAAHQVAHGATLESFADLVAGEQASQASIVAGKVLLHGGSLTDELVSTGASAQSIQAAKAASSQATKQAAAQSKSLVVVGGKIDSFVKANAAAVSTPAKALAETNLKQQQINDGAIDILGDTVVVEATAKIRADGQQGGLIRLGGDAKGAGTVKLADELVVKHGSVVSANGLTAAQVAQRFGLVGGGNEEFAVAQTSTTADAKVAGGQIYTWGNYSHVNTTLEAAGVDAGGFVETSGKSVNFGTDFKVNLAGKKIGTWLIDPEYLFVVNGSSSAPTAFPAGTPDYITALGLGENPQENTVAENRRNIGLAAATPTVTYLRDTQINQVLAGSNLNLALDASKLIYFANAHLVAKTAVDPRIANGFNNREALKDLSGAYNAANYAARVNNLEVSGLGQGALVMDNSSFVGFRSVYVGQANSRVKDWYLNNTYLNARWFGVYVNNVTAVNSAFAAIRESDRAPGRGANSVDISYNNRVELTNTLINADRGNIRISRNGDDASQELKFTGSTLLSEFEITPNTYGNITVTDSVIASKIKSNLWTGGGEITLENSTVNATQGEITIQASVGNVSLANSTVQGFRAVNVRSDVNAGDDQSRSVSIHNSQVRSADWVTIGNGLNKKTDINITGNSYIGADYDASHSPTGWHRRALDFRNPNSNGTVSWDKAEGWDQTPEDWDNSLVAWLPGGVGRAGVTIQSATTINIGSGDKEARFHTDDDVTVYGGTQTTIKANEVNFYSALVGAKGALNITGVEKSNAYGSQFETEQSNLTFYQQIPSAQVQEIRNSTFVGLGVVHISPTLAGNSAQLGQGHYHNLNVYALGIIIGRTLNGLGGSAALKITGNGEVNNFVPEQFPRISSFIRYHWNTNRGTVVPPPQWETFVTSYQKPTSRSNFGNDVRFDAAEGRLIIGNPESTSYQEGRDPYIRARRFSVFLGSEATTNNTEAWDAAVRVHATKVDTGQSAYITTRSSYSQFHFPGDSGNIKLTYSNFTSGGQNYVLGTEGLDIESSQLASGSGTSTYVNRFGDTNIVNSTIRGYGHEFSPGTKGEGYTGKANQLNFVDSTITAQQIFTREVPKIKEGKQKGREDWQAAGFTTDADINILGNTTILHTDNRNRATFNANSRIGPARREVALRTEGTINIGNPVASRTGDALAHNPEQDVKIGGTLPLRLFAEKGVNIRSANVSSNGHIDITAGANSTGITVDHSIVASELGRLIFDNQGSNDLVFESSNISGARSLSFGYATDPAHTTKIANSSLTSLVVELHKKGDIEITNTSIGNNFSANTNQLNVSIATLQHRPRKPWYTPDANDTNYIWVNQTSGPVINISSEANLTIGADESPVTIDARRDLYLRGGKTNIANAALTSGANTCVTAATALTINDSSVESKFGSASFYADEGSTAITGTCVTALQSILFNDAAATAADTLTLTNVRLTATEIKADKKADTKILGDSVISNEFAEDSIQKRVATAIANKDESAPEGWDRYAAGIWNPTDGDAVDDTATEETTNVPGTDSSDTEAVTEEVQNPSEPTTEDTEATTDVEAAPEETTDTESTEQLLGGNVKHDTSIMAHLTRFDEEPTQAYPEHTVLPATDINFTTTTYLRLGSDDARRPTAASGDPLVKGLANVSFNGRDVDLNPSTIEVAKRFTSNSTNEHSIQGVTLTAQSDVIVNSTNGIYTENIKFDSKWGKVEFNNDRNPINLTSSELVALKEVAINLNPETAGPNDQVLLSGATVKTNNFKVDTTAPLTITGGTQISNTFGDNRDAIVQAFKEQASGTAGTPPEGWDEELAGPWNPTATDNPTLGASGVNLHSGSQVTVEDSNITATDVSLNGPAINLDNANISASGNLKVTGGTVEATGSKLAAEGPAKVTGTSVTLTDTDLAGNGVTVSASTISTTGGTIDAKDGTAVISGDNSVSLSGTSLKGNKLDLDSAQGTVTLSGLEATANSSDAYAVNIWAKQKVELTAPDGQQTTITTPGKATITSDTAEVELSNTNVNAASLNITAETDVILNAGTAITTNGTEGQTITAKTGNVNLTDATLTATAPDGSTAGVTLSAPRGSLNAQGSNIAADSVSVSVGENVNLTNSNISVKEDLTLTGKNVKANGGLLKSDGNVTLNAEKKVELSTNITATNVGVTGDTVDITGGTTTATGTVTVNGTNGVTVENAEITGAKLDFDAPNGGIKVNNTSLTASSNADDAISLVAKNDVNITAPEGQSSSINTPNGGLQIASSEGAVKLANLTVTADHLNVTAQTDLELKTNVAVTTSGTQGQSFTAKTGNFSTAPGTSLTANAPEGQTANIDLSTTNGNVNLVGTNISAPAGTANVNAGGDVTLTNSNMSVRDELTLTAENVIATGSNLTSAAGVTVNANNSVQLTNTDVSGTEINSKAKTVSVTGGELSATGTVTLNGTNGVTLTDASLTGDKIDLDAPNGPVTVSGSEITATSSDEDAVSIVGQDVTLTAPEGKKTTVKSSGGVQLAGDNVTVVNSDVNATKAVNVTAVNNVKLDNANLTSDAAVNLTATNGNVTAENSELTAPNVNVNAGNKVSLTDTDVTGNDGVTLKGGTVDVTGGELTSPNGAVTVNGTNGVNLTNTDVSASKVDLDAPQGPLKVDGSNITATSTDEDAVSIVGQEVTLTAPEGKKTTVKSSGGVQLAGDNVTVVNSDVNATKAVNVTAVNNVKLDNANLTSDAAVNLTATNGNVTAENSELTAPNVEVNAGNKVSLTDTDVTADNGVTLNGGTVDVTGGQLTSPDGTVTVNGTNGVNLTNTDVTADKVDLDAPNGPLKVDGSNLTATSTDEDAVSIVGQDVTLTAPEGKKTTVKSSGGVQLAGDNVTVVNSDVNATKAVNVTAVNNVKLDNANLTSDAAVNLTATNGNVTAENSELTAPKVEVNAGNKVSLTDTDVTGDQGLTLNGGTVDVTGGELTSPNGTVTVNGTNGLSLTDTNLTGDKIDLDAPNGPVTVSGSEITATSSDEDAVSIVGQDVTLTAPDGKKATVNSKGGVQLAGQNVSLGNTDVNATKTINVTAANNVNLDKANLTSDAAVNLTATNGNVTAENSELTAPKVDANAGNKVSLTDTYVTGDQGLTLNGGTVDVTGGELTSPNGTVTVNGTNGVSLTDSDVTADKVDLDAPQGPLTISGTNLTATSPDEDAVSIIAGGDVTLTASDGKKTTINAPGGATIGSQTGKVDINHTVGNTGTLNVTAATDVKLVNSNFTTDGEAGQSFTAGNNLTANNVNLTSTADAPIKLTGDKVDLEDSNVTSQGTVTLDGNEVSLGNSNLTARGDLTVESNGPVTIKGSNLTSTNADTVLNSTGNLTVDGSKLNAGDKLRVDLKEPEQGNPVVDENGQPVKPLLKLTNTDIIAGSDDPTEDVPEDSNPATKGTNGVFINNPTGGVDLDGVRGRADSGDFVINAGGPIDQRNSQVGTQNGDLVYKSNTGIFVQGDGNPDGRDLEAIGGKVRLEVPESPTGAQPYIRLDKANVEGAGVEVVGSPRGQVDITGATNIKAVPKTNPDGSQVEQPGNGQVSITGGDITLANKPAHDPKDPTSKDPRDPEVAQMQNGSPSILGYKGVTIKAPNVEDDFDSKVNIAGAKVAVNQGTIAVDADQVTIGTVDEEGKATAETTLEVGVPVLAPAKLNAFKKEQLANFTDKVSPPEAQIPGGAGDLTVSSGDKLTIEGATLKNHISGDIDIFNANRKGSPEDTEPGTIVRGSTIEANKQETLPPGAVDADGNPVDGDSKKLMNQVSIRDGQGAQLIKGTKIKGDFVDLVAKGKNTIDFDLIEGSKVVIESERADIELFNATRIEADKIRLRAGLGDRNPDAPYSDSGRTGLNPAGEIIIHDDVCLTPDGLDFNAGSLHNPIYTDAKDCFAPPFKAPPGFLPEPIKSAAASGIPTGNLPEAATPNLAASMTSTGRDGVRANGIGDGIGNAIGNEDSLGGNQANGQLGFFGGSNQYKQENEHVKKLNATEKEKTPKISNVAVDSEGVVTEEGLITGMVAKDHGLSGSSLGVAGSGAGSSAADVTLLPANTGHTGVAGNRINPRLRLGTCGANFRDFVDQYGIQPEDFTLMGREGFMQKYGISQDHMERFEQKCDNSFEDLADMLTSQIASR